jgi:pyruvate/2-oxoglutarate dehydrogenase complex dihydrolipoamide acyltransferase (E2) component
VGYRSVSKFPTPILPCALSVWNLTTRCWAGPLRCLERAIVAFCSAGAASTKPTTSTLHSLTLSVCSCSRNHAHMLPVARGQDGFLDLHIPFSGAVGAVSSKATDTRPSPCLRSWPCSHPCGSCPRVCQQQMLLLPSARRRSAPAPQRSEAAEAAAEEAEEAKGEAEAQAEGEKAPAAPRARQHCPPTP